MFKEKQCKVCKTSFKQYRSTQKVCSTDCAIKLSEQTRQRKERQEWLKRKKVLQEKTMTITDWVLKVQKVFNSYIRERDKGKTCISCDRPLVGKFDAGHYHNANNHWSVRFDERNVWGQCVKCNRDLHGNLIKYRVGLISRIGVEEVDKLYAKSIETRKYAVYELKDLYEHYKSKKNLLYKNEG